ncbi:hypothetical protein BpHYR1_046394 [Brachionus plicatilis]|uniref:Uncharacterized protein n=1 Tax=Brachionus plicatilis TaxID=10195 RepID=A0A3M7RHK6_BRAPC|nr:hypothetical protein BpHYR1_046394 [Brachionus plicatilis]
MFDIWTNFRPRGHLEELSSLIQTLRGKAFWVFIIFLLESSRTLQKLPGTAKNHMTVVLTDRKLVVMLKFAQINNINLKKYFFKQYWKIMRHYSVEFLPKLLVLDLKTGDLLNAKIMSRMTELYHNFIKNCFKNNYLSNEDLKKRKFVCPVILSQLKKNLIDVREDEKREDGSRVLFLLYFCSYNTAIGTMNTYNEISKFLSQMPQLKRYLVKIVLISSDPSKESFLKLIEELKSNKSTSLSLSALSYESNKIKEDLLRDLQIIGIPWFVIIDSRKGLVLCENHV